MMLSTRPRIAPGSSLIRLRPFLLAFAVMNAVACPFASDAHDEDSTPVSEFPGALHVDPPGAPGTWIRPALGPANDSIHAVRIAVAAIRSSPSDTSYRVRTFLALEDGYIVQLFPHPVTAGGGGILWVTVTGEVLVVQRSR